MHITTTAIRGLYDTATDDLLSRNIISKQHQDSVLLLNGHSGAISHSHYIKKKAGNAVSDGRHVMELILNGDVDADVTKIQNNDKENVGSSAPAKYVVDEVNCFSSDDNNNMFEFFEGDHVDASIDERQKVEGIGSFQFNEESSEPYNCSTAERRNGDDSPFSDSGQANVYGVDFFEQYKEGGQQYEEGGGSRFGHHDHGQRRYLNNGCGDKDNIYGHVPNQQYRGEGSRPGYPDQTHRSYPSNGYVDNHNVYGQSTNERGGGGGGGGGGENRRYWGNDFNECSGRYKEGGNSKYFQHDLKNRFDDFGDSQLEMKYENNRSTSFSSDYCRGLPSPSKYYERRSYFPNRETDACIDEMEVLRPLPLRLHLQSKEAYVTWTKAEIEYTKKAYDVIYAQLPLDQKRFISKEVLKHIRNDPNARQIFHPSHLESSGKFRHVIRTYVEK